jgi:serine/threonine protein kinase
MPINKRYTFTVTDDEWKVAKKYLKNLPDGVMLYDTEHYFSGKRKTSKYHVCPYQIDHSFIKVSGKIYALAKGDGAILGEGSYGKVQFVLSEELQVFVTKIESEKAHEETPLENEILTDLNISHGKSFRDGSHEYRMGVEKHVFTIMEFLGTPLDIYLQQKTLNDDARLSIAIELCLKLADLHDGKNTKSHASYAHLDIKPDNVVINEKMEVFYIDFGFSEEDPNTKISEYKGTSIYLPKESLVERLPKKALDILALKRSLYLPNRFLCADGIKKRSTTKDSWILTDELMIKTCLVPYFDTGLKTIHEKTKQNEYYQPPMMLAALLILAKSNIVSQFHLVDITQAKSAREKAIIQTRINAICQLYRAGINDDYHLILKNISLANDITQTTDKGQLLKLIQQANSGSYFSFFNPVKIVNDFFFDTNHTNTPS